MEFIYLYFKNKRRHERESKVLTKVHDKPKTSLKCHRIWVCICNYAYPTAQVKLFFSLVKKSNVHSQ